MMINVFCLFTFVYVTMQNIISFPSSSPWSLLCASSGESSRAAPSVNFFFKKGIQESRTKRTFVNLSISFFFIDQLVEKQAYKLLYFTAGLLRYWVEKNTHTHTNHREIVRSEIM